MNTPNTPAWRALAAHLPTISKVSMREMFAADPQRFERYCVEAAGLFLDYSKNRIDEATRRLLLDLATESRLEEAINAMFTGEKINTTEQRAVLHTALRKQDLTPLCVDDVDVMPAVRSVLSRMKVFVTAVHDGEWRGHTGERITDIVNIGIGGSHLGPQMVCRALRLASDTGCKAHFVSNVDGTDIYEVLNAVNPASVLFIIASKTFTTQETMANAQTARSWFLDKTQTPQAIARHFVAASTNVAATSAFGIDARNVFEFWDWVGGRYSLWSAIGLPIALALGMDKFERLLAGGCAMDQHFRTAPLQHNIPVLLGLLEIWYTNFMGSESRVIAPYDQPLELLPAYLQQLDMESNGKRVRKDGRPVDYATSAAVWGAPGTNGQHAFFQLLHQGTPLIPVDFLAPMQSQTPLWQQHELLIANCFAQSEAFMRGKTEAEARAELTAAGLSGEALEALLPHKVFPGNRPSNTILYDRLTPETLGALIAMYEHKVFVAGTLWGINSFDQWGVELGKQLANQIVQSFGSANVTADRDCSTTGLIERYNQRRLRS